MMVLMSGSHSATVQQQHVKIKASDTILFAPSEHTATTALTHHGHD
jgi:hypothetical protein